MDSAIASDPLLVGVFRAGIGVLAISAALLAAILLMRLRLVARLARERRFAARWQPVLAACVDGLPERLPRLAAEEGPQFLALWLRALESLRGDAQGHLLGLAGRVGADRMAVEYLGSGDARRELLALVSLGHLRVHGAAPLAEGLAAVDSPVISLTAAQALLRIDPVRALPGVLGLAARREDWPVARIAAMLRECEPGLSGRTLIEAIDERRSAPGGGAGLARLLRILGAVAAEDARPAVLRVLAEPGDPNAAAAALDALWHPEDAPLARAHAPHPEWYVRLAAVKAIGRIGTAEDHGLLAGMLSDANWWVRYRAAQALARLPGASRTTLERLRTSVDDRFAADMLGQVVSELDAR